MCIRDRPWCAPDQRRAPLFRRRRASPGFSLAFSLKYALMGAIDDFFSLHQMPQASGIDDGGAARGPRRAFARDNTGWRRDCADECG
eukprot:9720510-Alexandrium_andersonii.AAC.1